MHQLILLYSQLKGFQERKVVDLGRGEVMDNPLMSLIYSLSILSTLDTHYTGYNIPSPFHSVDNRVLGSQVSLSSYVGSSPTWLIDFFIEQLSGI